MDSKVHSMSVRFVSAFILASVGLISLAACGDHDLDMPKIFGSEVPDQVLNEPRPIPVPPPSHGEQSWMQVGAVPQHPKDFTPQPVIDAAKKDMEQDRSEGMQMQNAYQTAPPVESTFLGSQ